MPKAVFTYNDFSGGRCTGLDSTKLPRNYISDSYNVIVNNTGRIESIKRFNNSAYWDDLDMSYTIDSYDKIYLYNAPFKFSYLTTGDITDSSGTALVTTPTAHGLSTGDTVIHTGFSELSYNGIFTVTKISNTTYTFGVSYVITDSGVLRTIVDTTSDVPMLVTTVANSNGYISIYQLDNTSGVMEDITYLYSGDGIVTMYNGDNHLYISYFDSSDTANNIRKRISRVNHTICSTDTIDTVDISSVTYSAPTNSLMGEIPNSWSTAFCINNVDTTNSTQTELYSADMDDYNIGGFPTETYYLYYYNGFEPSTGIYSIISQTYDSGAGEYYITTDTRVGSTISTSDRWFVYPPAGKGIGVYMHPVDTVGGKAGTWDIGDYEVATSFIYIDGAESEPVKVDGTNKTTLSGSNSVMSVAIVLTLPFPSTIIGSRVYYRTYGSSEEWKLLIDIDFTKGYRLSTNTDYLGTWTVQGTHSGCTLMKLYGGITDYQHIAVYNPSAETYRSINGYRADEGSVELVPKCVAVGGNRAWFGAPTIKDVDDNTTYHNSRVYYSPIGKYGVTPTSYYVDIMPTDGKEVTAILYYEGKLFIFKGTLVYIVDVSSGNPLTWYVQSHFDCGGDDSITDNNITITDYGPVWVCSTGCYIYNSNDGTINNLVYRAINGIDVMTQNDWGSYVSAPNSRVGYNKYYKELIVIGNYDFTLNTDRTYILDMSSMAWAIGDATGESAIKYTNMINYNQHLFTIGQSGSSKPEVMYWGINSLSSSNSMTIYTKMEDFDLPDKAKYIYSVRLKHGSTASINISVSYKRINTDGTEDSSYTAISTEAISADGYTIYTLSTPIVCQAIQFKVSIESVIPSTYDYHLDEIGVEYRAIYKSIPT